MGKQSLPWPYAHIYALICAIKYAHFMLKGNQASARTHVAELRYNL